MLGEGTLQARYIRGAFDDKPFTLGKYENTRIRVAIAELAANGGARIVNRGIAAVERVAGGISSDLAIRTAPPAQPAPPAAPEAPAAPALPGQPGTPGAPGQPGQPGTPGELSPEQLAQLTGESGAGGAGGAGGAAVGPGMSVEEASAALQDAKAALAASQSAAAQEGNQLQAQLVLVIAHIPLEHTGGQHVHRHLGRRGLGMTTRGRGLHGFGGQACEGGTAMEEVLHHLLHVSESVVLELELNGVALGGLDAHFGNRLDAGEGETITMQRRLLLSGHVTDNGRPLGDVLVSLIRHSGEYVGTTTADATGAYEIGLPPAGRYVLTVVDHATGRTRSRALTVLATSTTLDIDIVTGIPRPVEHAGSSQGAS